jgi:hypothetical protein
MPAALCSGPAGHEQIAALEVSLLFDGVTSPDEPFVAALGSTEPTWAAPDAVFSSPGVVPDSVAGAFSSGAVNVND